MWTYLLFFLIASLLSICATMLTRRIALKRGIVDSPQNAPERKFQPAPVPLLGGWAIFISIGVSVGIALLTTGLLTESFLSARQITGMIVGAFVILLGGTIDDTKGLSASKQILFPIVASVLVIGFGFGVSFITSPFGGVLSLDTVQFKILTIGSTSYHVTLWADVFAFVWLMVMMYATKLLDGVDGLATGVGTIGAFVLFVLSLTEVVNQPGTALVAIIVAGSFAGFLLYNRFPARMYLGESGSLLIGFFLGMLAIISGAKIATAILIFALPILDVVWVMFTRLFRGKKIWQADRLHLHFRLQDKGVSPKKVLGIFFSLSLLFGMSAVFADSKIKFLLLCLAILCSLGLLVFALQKKQS